MQEYVATMLRYPSTNEIVFLDKTRGPEGVRGFWNLIGGKVETGEDFFRAHIRECLEETGIDLLETAYMESGFKVQFRQHSVVHFARFDVYRRLPKPNLPKMNDVGELLKWQSLDSFGRVNGEKRIVQNLHWIAPLLSHTRSVANTTIHLG